MVTLTSLKAAPMAALFAALLAVLAAAVPARPASAQELRFFRIGTGSISGVYFAVGGLMANIISNPPGSRSCESGGSCGVPGMVAVAQATLGSVANVRAIEQGALESALVQADIASFAYNAKGPFAGDKPMTGLRAIANLYPEAVHVVVRRNSPIRTVADLRGRRVSLDLVGSGTRAVALLVLDGYGLKPGDIKQVNSQIGPAADRVQAGSIDAFFFVGGYPVAAVSRLAREVPIRMLPIEGSAAAAIRRQDPFLAAARLPAGTYRNVDAVATLAVRAQWLVSEKVSAETVYGITRALWHENSRRLLDHGVPSGAEIKKESALAGIAVPLHPGAERFYREQGMLEQPKATEKRKGPRAP